MYRVEWDDNEGIRHERYFQDAADATAEREALAEKYDYAEATKV